MAQCLKYLPLRGGTFEPTPPRGGLHRRANSYSAHLHARRPRRALTTPTPEPSARHSAAPHSKPTTDELAPSPTRARNGRPAQRQEPVSPRRAAPKPRHRTSAPPARSPPRHRPTARTIAQDARSEATGTAIRPCARAKHTTPRPPHANSARASATAAHLPTALSASTPHRSHHSGGTPAHNSASSWQEAIDGEVPAVRARHRTCPRVRHPLDHHRATVQPDPSLQQVAGNLTASQQSHQPGNRRASSTISTAGGSRERRIVLSSSPSTRSARSLSSSASERPRAQLRTSIAPIRIRRHARRAGFRAGYSECGAPAAVSTDDHGCAGPPALSTPGGAGRRFLLIGVMVYASGRSDSANPEPIAGSGKNAIFPGP